MCNVPGNFLLTYDPNLTELHSDSSDFEGTYSPKVTHKNGNHRLHMKKLYPKPKEDLNLQTCNSQTYTVTEDSSKEMWESQTTTISHNGGTLEVHKTYKNRKSKTLDSGDQIQTIKSKRSLIRHKVIPCLSSMFGRSSNNVKQMSIIKENQAENVNIDNGCQATRVNCEHRIRKFNRRQQCYAVQPVYAVEGNVHAKSTPFQHTKIVQEPLSTRKTVGNENYNVNYSLTSSSDGNETQRFLKRKKGKHNKSKHVGEPDMEKDSFKHYEGPDLKRNIEQQCPSKLSRKCPYHVYTTPYQYQRTSAGCSPMGSNANRLSGSELPATCSGFWEYLFNKINMKYQAQTVANSFKPCKCNAALTDSSHCCAATCEKNINPQNFPPQMPQAYYQNNPSKQESCSCSTSFPQTSPLNINERIQPRPSPIVPPFKIKSPEKVECKCFQKKPVPTPPQASTPLKSSPSPVPPEPPRPCQLTHEEITGTLTRKYNGEILCIHNPPCVLINGCLNLPPPKEDLTMNMWSVTTKGKSDKPDYQPVYTKSSKKQKSAQYCFPPLDTQQQCQIMDVSCQYFPPAQEMQAETNNKMNEGCQYQNPNKLRQLMVSDSCQYHLAPPEMRKQLANESCQYRLSPTEIPKQQATANESCQYWLSPTVNQKHQITTNESCQYQLSPTEIHKHQISYHSYEKIQPVIELKLPKSPQPKKEKIVQSICNHDPPCEVVRTCCKTRFDPKLQNSCVHVPMCEKVPLCLMELKNQTQAITSCQHKPKCAEVPICTRNYIILTAKEEAATQVRPKTKMVCRHEPPCIMIPTCLARVCDSYIPYDAIPDCVHQPMCEMIPACCRKSAKEMVSVRSQYPNQCCIV